MYEDLVDRDEARDKKDYKVKYIKMENMKKSVPQVTISTFSRERKKQYWSQGLKVIKKTFEHTRSEIHSSNSQN